MITLPVSLGEALDKLSILEIKLDMVKDDRRNDVKVEYDLLYAILKEYISDSYTLLKTVNLDIWNLMDRIRIKCSDEEYMTLCKETIEANDVRFRIKKKINKNSIIKEQKGYEQTKILVHVTDKVDMDFIKLLCIYYDHVFIYNETTPFEVHGEDNVSFIDFLDPTINTEIKMEYLLKKKM